jgi:ABC-type multidrug transport system fused ATPase/permease subunit
MSSAIFLLLVLLLGAGFCWTLQEVLTKGKWSYFIYFLAAYLPIYITSLSLAYLATDSIAVVKSLQVLKEIVVVTALIAAVLYQKNPLDYPFRLQVPDWCMGGLLLLGFLYLVLPIGEASLLNKALYFKGMVIPGLIYFLGRNTNFSREEIHRLFSMIFGVAIFAFLLNLIENYILNAHIQQYTGYTVYNQVINNLEPSGNFGLTWTFETQAVTKRLASFFSDPLELASSVLMGFAAGLIFFLTSKKELGWFYLLVMACSVGSLIFSASRAAFGAFFLMLFFVALVFKLYKLLAIGFTLLLSFGIYVLFFASEDMYYFVLDTLTFENSSSAGHVLEWLVALESMMANPLGIGLAMSGNAGSVSDALRVGGENQFLIYGVQLGWLGMGLYILLLGLGIYYCITVFYTSTYKSVARIAFVGGVVKFGLLLPLFTANVEIYTYVSWMTWWMVGFSVQHYSILQHQSLAHDSAQELSSL